MVKSKKNEGTFLYQLWVIWRNKVPLFFLFDHSLGARAEICQIFSSVKKFILKSSDLKGLLSNLYTMIWCIQRSDDSSFFKEYWQLFDSIANYCKTSLSLYACSRKMLPYDPNFWIPNWCFGNPIKFLECHPALSWTGTFNY